MNYSALNSEQLGTLALERGYEVYTGVRQHQVAIYPDAVLIEFLHTYDQYVNDLLNIEGQDIENITQPFIFSGTTLILGYGRANPQLINFNYQQTIFVNDLAWTFPDYVATINELNFDGKFDNILILMNSTAELTIEDILIYLKPQGKLLITRASTTEDNLINFAQFDELGLSYVDEYPLEVIRINDARVVEKISIETPIKRHSIRVEIYAYQ